MTATAEHAWFHLVADRVVDPLLLLSARGALLTANLAGRRLVQPDGGPLARHVEDEARLTRYLTLVTRSASTLPGTLVFSGSGARYRCDASAVDVDERRFVVLQLRRNADVVERFVALNKQIEMLHGEIRRRHELEVERASLLAREREARTSAEEANRFKDELLASVSHELRTPIHAISGWVTLLREAPTDLERVRKAADVIERNSSLLGQLTEDLIDVSLVVTGRMKLEVQRVELERVLREAVETITPAVRAKDQRLEVIADTSGCTVEGDPARLVQVFWNLLSNASRYTPRGGKIQVVLRRVNSHAEISVSDTGEGISADLLPYVFDRFRRGDASSRRRHGGLGLGLSIVRHLIELHGGIVTVASDGEGRGATFMVTLPLPLFARSGPLETAAEPEPSEPLSQLHVLLVEDHDDSRDLLSSILESRGARVSAFDRTAEALAAYGTARPDLLISDIEMPEEDGITFIRKVRALEKEAGERVIPAVAVSAHATGSVRLSALQAGFQVFLSKPLKAAELLAVVARLCDVRGDH